LKLKNPSPAWGGTVSSRKKKKRKTMVRIIQIKKAQILPPSERGGTWDEGKRRGQGKRKKTDEKTLESPAQNLHFGQKDPRVKNDVIWWEKKKRQNPCQKTHILRKRTREGGSRRELRPITTETQGGQ